MNPYASNPKDIPATDSYADIPFYGRYFPQPDDFRVDLVHIQSQSEESLKYWASVLDLCNESNRIYPADERGRDVFALGSVIVKSSHLHESSTDKVVDYSYADANEVQAIAIAKSFLNDMGVRVPEIYFAGKVRNGQVLVQERIPGVALNVAWPYLSLAQKQSFKQQARAILRRLWTITPTDGRTRRSHVVPDPNIHVNGRIGPTEERYLFSCQDDNPDMGFMHNDFTDSNCLVDDDRIVGLVDWEMAGFWGWSVAAEIHRRVRTPQREHFTKVDLSEERLRDIMWWNDLYDEGVPEVQG